MSDILLVCSGCVRHIKDEERVCPFCGTPVVNVSPAPVKVLSGFSRVALMTFGAAGALTTMVSCGPVTLYGAPPPVDNDQDGSSSYEDCNDNDPSIAPGAVDPLGDGIDQNCDGVDGTANSGAGGAGGAGGGGMGGMGGAGGGVPCDRCGAYITSPTPGADLCPDSVKLFNDLVTCLCGDANNPAITSACGANGTIDKTCADNACKGLAPTPDCTTCQGKANNNECKMQFNTCANDI